MDSHDNKKNFLMKKPVNEISKGYRKLATFFPGTGLATSVSSHAIGETSPPLSPITMSHTTPSIYSNLNTAGHNTYQGIQGGK